MFEILYNMVDHKFFHMWDVLCVILLLMIVIVAGVHIYKQRKREDDFEDEMDDKYGEDEKKENLRDVGF